MDDTLRERLPGWLPGEAGLYLAHVVGGEGIRSLARREGRHASTILRQIRRCEERRDDPLFDIALRRLGGGVPDKEEGTMNVICALEAGLPDGAELASEARRILPRLSEAGACLAVAEGMEKAVIVRETPDGQTLRVGVVGTPVAEAMALKGWISKGGKGRIARYRITSAGRQALAELIADGDRKRVADDAAPGSRARYGQVETPLAMLARRRDRDGRLFLPSSLVRCGERLREDYEIAEMGSPTDWEALIGSPPDEVPQGTLLGAGPDAARIRVALALSDLGPGLGNVVWRVCCLLEGLESVERRMDWAARSGKVVLRIALERLERHYAKVHGDATPRIG